MNYRLGDFPVAEKVAAEIVSLPMFPQLTAEQQGRVVEKIARFVQTALPKQAMAESAALTPAEQSA
jgi:dTDP-4-amino-4,6-dideoxygalactose transaminase